VQDLTKHIFFCRLFIYLFMYCNNYFSTEIWIPA